MWIYKQRQLLTHEFIVLFVRWGDVLILWRILFYRQLRRNRNNSFLESLKTTHGHYLQSNWKYRDNLSVFTTISTHSTHLGVLIKFLEFNYKKPFCKYKRELVLINLFLWPPPSPPPPHTQILITRILFDLSPIHTVAWQMGNSRFIIIIIIIIVCFPVVA